MPGANISSGPKGPGDGPTGEAKATLKDSNGDLIGEATLTDPKKAEGIAYDENGKPVAKVVVTPLKEEKPRPEPKPNPEPEPKPKPELKPEPNPDPESKPKPELKPEPNPDPEQKPKPELKPTLKAKRTMMILNVQDEADATAARTARYTLNEKLREGLKPDQGLPADTGKIRKFAHGIKGFVRGITSLATRSGRSRFKHHIAEDYYLERYSQQEQKLLREVYKRLSLGEDIDELVGGKEKAKALRAEVRELIGRMKQGHVRGAEELREINEGASEADKELSRELTELIKTYAAPDSKMTLKECLAEKEKIIERYKEKTSGKKDSLFTTKDDVTVDEFKKLIKDYRSDVRNGEIALDDIKLQVNIGRAASTVRETNKSRLDRVAKFLQRHRLTAAIANPLTLGLGVSLGVGMMAAKTGLSIKATALGAIGAGALISGAFAAFRKRKEVNEDLAYASQLRTLGQDGKDGTRTKELQDLGYKQVDGEKLVSDLKNANRVLVNFSRRKQKPVSIDELVEPIKVIVTADTLINEGHARGKDFIRLGPQPQKRIFEVEKQIAKAKIALKELVAAGKVDASVVEDMAKALQQSVSVEVSVNVDKTDNDRARYRKRQMYNAFRRTALTGAVSAVVVGGALAGARELVEHHGQIDLFGHHVGGQGHDSVQVDSEPVAADGPAVEVHHLTPEEFVGRNAEHTLEIHRHTGSWMDNNTHQPDFNEVRVYWAGEHGSGINADGSIDLTLKHMAPDGSFHDGAHIDPQALGADGKLGVFISASKDTQNHPFFVPVDHNGAIHITPDNPAYAFFGRTADGQAVFNGHTLEIAAMPADGSAPYILATLKGHGMESIPVVEHVPVTPVVAQVPAHPDYVWPVIPSSKRDALAVDDLIRRKKEEEEELEEAAGRRGWHRKKYNSEQAPIWRR
ncbi:MAG: LPXTG cell wall anchor domain-containing protein [Candidatus Dadabacteria bacterium]|nr:MAG: LPXTG cell wall anchor domain-containing protein [Candidatus Dadabacteria bacterium]